MPAANPKIDRFLDRATSWREEMEQLRGICLKGELTEEVKWGKPCYSWEGGNVCIIQPFSKYVALMFFKGALLKSNQDDLHTPGEHARAARQFRFTSPDEVNKLEPAIRTAIEEAIELEKSGAKFDFDKDRELPIPDELQAALDDDAKLRSAFEDLTPGRQRGYILHFSGAKQSKTRASRVEKAIPDILEGRGLRD